MKLALLAVLATVLLAPQLVLAAEPENPYWMSDPYHPGPHDGHTDPYVVSNPEDPTIGDLNRANNPEMRVMLTGSEIPPHLMLIQLVLNIESWAADGEGMAVRGMKSQTGLDDVEAQRLIDAVRATQEDLDAKTVEHRRQTLCRVSDGPAGANIYTAFAHIQDQKHIRSRAALAKLRGELGQEMFDTLERLLIMMARGSVFFLHDHAKVWTVNEAEERLERICDKYGYIE